MRGWISCLFAAGMITQAGCGADLEDSAPYFHNGSKARFSDVVEFYIRNSQLARQGLLRNAPAEFQGMSLSESDVSALAAFLASLTEDYDDA